MRDTLIHDLADPRSLISRLLATHSALPGGIDPGDSPRLVYNDFDTFHLQQREERAIGGIGELHIARSPSASGVQFRFAHRRMAIGPHSTFTTAELDCDDDIWATPRRWSFDARVAERLAAEEFPLTRLRKECRFEGGVLEVRPEGGSPKRTRIDGPATCKWCLFDVVSRAVRRGGSFDEPFTMINEYDVPVPGQRLRLFFRGGARTRGGEAEVACFLHTGTGTLPGLFWAAADGTVIACLSGAQGFVLAQSGDDERHAFLPVRTEEAPA